MQAPYDLVAHTVLFSRSLREQGLLVGPSDTTDSIRSLGMVDLMDREQVYWAFRTILVSRVGEIAAFDHCFRQFWDFRRPQGRQPSLPGPAMDGVMRSFSHGSATVADDGRPGETQPPLAQIVRTGASPVEVLARRDLTEFKGDQLEKVSKIAAQIIRALPTRPGRRRRRHRRKGLPDLRGALRLNLSHGGDLITLPRRRRVLRTPILLLLLDVSGSMDRYAEMLLQLAYALGQRAGRVETFVFSTSLTRVTRQLRVPSYSYALRRVGDLVRHWSGGTRIGHCLEALNRGYPDLLNRNTSVILMSDGWETGDPDHLAREIARLRRQVRRLVWLNPLQGTPDYAPLALGLQAARPHVDRFAPAPDVEHLKLLPRLLRG